MRVSLCHGKFHNAGHYLSQEAGPSVKRAVKKLTESSELNLMVDQKWVTAAPARQQCGITPIPHSGKST